eukprot:c45978_g1_i1.p1 GENE.c45978_g1_i1~~c45978_g1_i1.p1  ORF type:complete len:463 (+),score=97.15 c45978_g1_i1:43-1431(+)
MALANLEVKHAHKYSTPQFYEKASDSAQCLQGVCMANLTGTIHQIGMMAEFSRHLFASLMVEAEDVHARMNGLQSRIGALGQKLPKATASLIAQSKSDIKEVYLNRSVPASFPQMEESGLFLPESLITPLRFRVEATNPPPNLSALDHLAESTEKSCLTKYTDPNFFMDEWRLEQERHLEKEKERRKAKKQKKIKEGSAVKKPVEKITKRVFDVDGRVVSAPQQDNSSNLIKKAQPPPRKQSSKADSQSEFQPTTAVEAPIQQQMQQQHVATMPTPPPMPPSHQHTAPPPPPPPSVVGVGAPVPPPPPPAAVGFSAPVAPQLPPANIPAPPPPPPMIPSAPALPPSAPAPPPPPNAPNAPAPPPPPPSSGGGGLTDILSGIGSVKLKKAAEQAPAPKVVDAREDLLSSIRQGRNLQLRKVEKDQVQAKQTNTMANSVAAILQRRLALGESSDSESESEGDWD